MNTNDQHTGTPTGSVTTTEQPVASRMAAPTGALLKTGFPSRVAVSTWPSTLLDHAAVLERVFAAPFTLENSDSQVVRRNGVLAVLDRLTSFPGEDWQQRWEASGAESAEDWRELFAGKSSRR